MSELPKGWCWANLNELSLLINGDRGKNYPSKNAVFDSGVPFINAGHLVNGQIDYSHMKYITEEHFILLGGGKIQRDDILYCLRGSLGKIAFVTDIGKGAIASSLVIIRPLENNNPKYLYYFLVSPLGKDEIFKHDNGSAQPNLSAANVGSYRVSVSPLNEQHRIVAKLDRLFSHYRRVREELEQIPKLIERYKQAVLAAAFRGELTADWREENSVTENAKDLLIRLKQQQGLIRELISDSDLDRDFPCTSLPNNWCRVQVQDIGKVFLGRQRSPKNHNGSDMRPYVRAANITWNGWELSDIKEMNFDAQDFRKYKLKAGDVLINEGSGSADEVGKPAIWNNEIENCCFQNTLICVRPFESMSTFLYFVFFRAAHSKIFVEETRGVNIFHIGKERLSQFEFALPPLAEQKEIVQRIEKLFKAIAFMEQEYQKASSLCDRLEQATLAKAFRGELVPQNPDDEPASVLLERILAEQHGKANTKHGRTKKAG